MEDAVTRDSLTEREKDVASLVACGLSYGQVAKDLRISRRTVEKHVERIFKKLRLHKQSQLAHWWLDNELAEDGGLP
jgi:non-specific serine/threonine protein kinase